MRVRLLGSDELNHRFLLSLQDLRVLTNFFVSCICAHSFSASLDLLCTNWKVLEVTPSHSWSFEHTMFLYSDETTRSHLAATLPSKVVSLLLAPPCFLSTNKRLCLACWPIRVWLCLFLNLYFCSTFSSSRYGRSCILLVRLWACYQDRELPLVPALGWGWRTGTHLRDWTTPL